MGRKPSISKQEKAINALLLATSQKEAARKAGIDLSTLKRYLKDPSFQARYKEARDQITAATVGRLQAAAPLAVAKLVEIINDPAAKQYVKVQACRTVLEMSLKATELEKLGQIEERITELEQQKAG